MFIWEFFEKARVDGKRKRDNLEKDESITFQVLGAVWLIKKYLFTSLT